MEIDLNRLDLIHAGQSDPGTMALFEPGKSRHQKVIVGDRTGLVQCFGVKKTEAYNLFKSLPFNQTITSIVSGHGHGQKDKAYLACDQTIRGMNKKGKEFFRFTTNLTEKITKVIVEDSEMWLAGEYNFNQYSDCKDKHFYMSPDRINDFALIEAGGTAPKVMLACQDRCARVLEGGEVYYEVGIDGPVTRLEADDTRDAAMRAVLGSEKEVLYGTANGQVGQVLLNSDSIRRGWVVAAERQGCGVTALSSSSDFTNDGLPDILVGRTNGQLEVWGMDEAYEPHKVMTKDLNESVQSLDSGYVCTPDAKDIILQTFSGKVVAFTNSPSVFQPETLGGKTINKETQIRVLGSEINDLKAKLEAEKRKAEAMAIESPAVAGSILEIRHSFVLDESTSGKYVLTVEAPVPLFGVAVQSDVAVHLVEDAGTAIVSHSPPDIVGGSMCLASYRCQEKVNRVEVHMEVVEGQYGSIQAFVIPAVPPKTCTVVNCRLRPLCLHCRAEAPPSDSTPLNELKVTGAFELSDIHSWIAFALPEVSDRAPIDGESVLHFKSTLLGTSLICAYKAGQGTFRSDSISALAILREAVSKEANSSKLRVSITYQLNQDSVAHVLDLLWPQLAALRDLARRVSIVEALQELKMQDGDVSYMSDEQREDLKNVDRLRKDLATQPRRLEYLIGVVKDLYIDWSKFNGAALSSSKKVPDLDRMLHDPKAQCGDVVEFILSS